MGIAFRVSIVKKAFQDNGQVSKKEHQLPNIDAMVGTYRGIIDKDNYLYNKNDIISTYYKEMYENGRIEESTFDKEGVIHDTDTMGKTVSRDFGIHRESCQCQNFIIHQTKASSQGITPSNTNQPVQKK